MPIMLVYEGGYVDHPNDPGGATNMGVTIGRLSEVRGRKVSKAEVKALTLAEAQEIYDRYYWRPVRGDDLPYGVDLTVFDYGVNSGPSRAAKELQRVVGATVDGRIGGETLKATILADGKRVIKAICARRLSFMRSLRIWETFKRGWSRRVADVEAKALAMWLARGGALTDAHRAELEREADAAAGKSDTQGKAAGGVTAGGTGGVGIEAMTDPNWLMIGCIVLVAVVVGGLLIVHARKNGERASAFKAVASA